MGKQTKQKSVAPKDKFRFKGKFPTGEELRHAMLDRAQEFHSISGKSLSSISKRATGNISFLTKIRGGENFSVKSYDLFMRGMDRMESAVAKSKA